MVRKLRVVKRPEPAASKATVRRVVKPASSSAKSSASPKTRKRAANGNGAYDVGMEGFDKASDIREQQQAEYERKKNMPFRFRLKPGEGADLVMLDETPFFIKEHSWKEGQSYHTDICIADTGETCPLCTKLGKEGSYTLMCTGIDKRKYKTKDGKEVKLSKKLVPVKAKNIAKFERIWKRHKSIRGLVLAFHRDGEKESSIGEDITDTGRKVDAATLRKMGEVAVLPNYKEIFAAPDADELRQRHGVSAPLGSADFGKGGDNVDDDIPW